MAFDQREDGKRFWPAQNTNLLPLKNRAPAWSNSSAFGYPKRQLAASAGANGGPEGCNPVGSLGSFSMSETVREGNALISYGFFVSTKPAVVSAVVGLPS